MSAARLIDSWPALGTTATVIVTDERDLASARTEVERELAAIDLACSRFRADSELSRVNASAGRPVPVGPLLYEALETALRAAVLTDGAVDPTIGEALELAGYVEDFATAPPLRRPLRAVRVPGWRTVRLEPHGRLVGVPRGVRLDLGATAKAVAADRAAGAAAHAIGERGVLVNLGGDLAVAGTAPDAGWTVRVTDDHRAGPDAPGQTVTISSGGLATSSTTVRRWGPRHHHLIDPASGMPLAGRWRTVSVAAASCVDANIASTAAIVLGDDGEAWLRTRGLPARLVAVDGHAETVADWPRELVAA